MPEPGLHGAHVDPGAEPAGCRSVADAMEMSFLGGIFAAVEEVPVIEAL